MSSHFINQMTTEVLNLRPPKEESIDTLLKHVLFIRTRKNDDDSTSSNITNNIIQTYEKTPSCLAKSAAPLDEILERQRAIELIKALLENLSQQRTIIGTSYNFGETNSRTTPIIGFDEIFAQNKFQLICNCSFYVNAFYNHHLINSVEALDLAIVCIWLATKVNSNFKRLDKILLTAKNVYKVELKSDRGYYTQLESQILQSLGFALDLADDTPQNYIIKYNQHLGKTCDAFKANLRIKTIFEVAMQLANTITWVTPLPLNRDSSHLAAACLFIANKFNRIMNRSQWWLEIENCSDLTEKKLFELSDLVFDVLKYHKNGWCYQPGVNCMLSMASKQRETLAQRTNLANNEKIINSPFSNYSSTSNQTSGFMSNGSSPHSSMVSLPSVMSPCSTTSGFSINKMIDPDENSKDEQKLSPYISSNNSNKSATVSSDVQQKMNFQNRNFDIFNDNEQTNDPRRDRKGFWASNQSSSSKKPDFSRPEKIPYNVYMKNRRKTIAGGMTVINNLNVQSISKKRKITETSSLSPSKNTARKTNNFQTEMKRLKPENNIYRGSPRPDRNLKSAIIIPSEISVVLGKDGRQGVNNYNNRFGGFLTGKSRFELPTIHTQDLPKSTRKREPSAHSISSDQQSLSSQISFNSSTISSISASPKHNISLNSDILPGSISNLNMDLNKTLTETEGGHERHPDEKNYKSRLDGISNNNQILMFYSKKCRYKFLNRQERDIVKRGIKSLKAAKIEKQKRRRTMIGL